MWLLESWEFTNIQSEYTLVYVWILTFDENSIVAAEGTFDFDLELKKRSSFMTILDKKATLLIGSQSFVFDLVKQISAWFQTLDCISTYV